jgi:diacylglycerol kinase (ATP)
MLVVLNPRAGGGHAGRMAGEVQDWLKRHHPQVGFFVSERAAAARALIAEQTRGSRVVVVGGDGSLHQLLPAVLDGGHELGLVPAGSGDDSARALGLHGLAWPRALSRALLAPAKAVDIGWIHTEHEQRPFFSSLCAGFDAAVAQRALALPAWLRGQPRYLWATLREIAALRLHTLHVHADGVRIYEGPALFASTLNTISYGGGMPAVPHAKIDDGRLDLLLAGAYSRGAALAMLPRLLRGKHLGAEARLFSVALQKLQIEAEAPLPLAADGEPMTDAQRITVRVGQQLLRVVGGPPEP